MTQTSERTAERRGARSDQAEDRFDRVPRSGRVGAHRFTARPRYVWQYLIAGLLGFALLTTAGIIAVHSIGGAGKFSNPSGGGSSSSQATDAELNPDATVVVLNGTETANLAAAVDQIITQEQWGQIRFSGAASSSDVTISAVFYTDPADAPAAWGLAAKLGGLSAYLTEDYASYEVQLVVVLGSDYAGPGIEEAQRITDGGEEEPPASGGGQINPETGNAINPETGYDTNPATGYDINPATGYDIDPATGWDLDPATGWPIDPATGLPTDPATLPAA